MKSFCASMAVISLVWASVAMAAPQAAAQSSSAPTLVRVDGQVKTPTGDARSGSVALVVSLYAEKDDATPLWVERQTVTLDAAGRYTIFAGATLPDGVPQAFVSGSTPGRWLGVGVQGEAEQFRMMLVTVPYALKAREADTLAGKSATDFVLSENLGDTVQAALKADLGKSSSASGGGPGVFGTVNAIQKGAGGAAIQDATGFVEVGGKIGIGTTGPFTLLDLGTGFGAGDAGRKLSLYNDGTFFYGFSVHPGALGISASKTAGAADDVTIPASGNVGIGTASPATLLDVNKSNTGSTAISIRNPTAGPINWARLDIKTDAAGGRGLFDAYSSTFTTSANSVQAGVSFTAIGAGGFSIALQDAAAPMRFYTGAGPSERMRIASGGNVGIGTTTPGAKLEVVGGIIAGGNPGTAVDARTSSGGWAVFGYCTQANSGCWALEGLASTGTYAGVLIGGRGIYASSADDSYPAVDAYAGGSDAYGIRGESNTYRGGYIKTDSSSFYSLLLDSPGASSPGLYVNGNIYGAGNLVMGGSKAGYVVDIMQNVDSAALEPGDVVAIVGNSTPVLGQIPVVTVKKATSAYDTGAAGVVDAVWYAPDLATKAAYDAQEQAVRVAMTQRANARAAVAGSKTKPVEVAMPEMKITDQQGTLHALSGVTSAGPGGYLSVVTLGSYKTVKVDASFGPIRAGDLLTTSPNAGYAMKVTDKVAAIGAIIGKALGNLDSGTGTIPILVMPK